ncbi:MAG: hypothetical protein EKK41_04450 [Hyphomicrobiales bacterium]|nr:MAG: hypothetical protein EKK41_04450 [Hyphomicrobiales bacterium]
MPHFALRIMSAGAAAFFGGLFVGWIVLGQPFAGSDRAVAAAPVQRFEAPKPGRIALRPEDERLADPGAVPREAAPEVRPAPKEEAKPRAAEPKIAEQKPAEVKPLDPKKPADSKPTETKPGDVAKPDAKPGEPEIFPTRRLKKIAKGALPGMIIGLLDDEDDD